MINALYGLMIILSIGTIVELRRVRRRKWCVRPIGGSRCANCPWVAAGLAKP